ncbi:hypothetical protein FKW77_000081 [Venturia effusa]|uniref:Uncharacterized protein n=1 Tax=Venturia effusa TaxID=50376 RepID=A0A517L2H0_9PEZI|nr:hypothetical protein FKW77_000081 [Venturia effusa]
MAGNDYGFMESTKDGMVETHDDIDVHDRIGLRESAANEESRQLHTNHFKLMGPRVNVVDSDHPSTYPSAQYSFDESAILDLYSHDTPFCSPLPPSCQRRVDPLRQNSSEDWRASLYGGSIEGVRSMLRKANSGVVNEPIAEYDQNLPLHVAASRGKAHTEVLLQAGAHVDGTNRRNATGTALQWAAAMGCFETVELLLYHNANVNAMAGRKGTALIAAIKTENRKRDTTDNRSVVALLLGYGADPNQMDLYRCSPLCAANDLRTLELLLDYGANVDALPVRDQHALINSVHINSPRTGRLLLQWGADANMHFRNSTVLRHAIALKHLDVAIELIEHGATFDEQDSAALIMLSLKQENVALLLALINHGVNPMTLQLPLGAPIMYAPNPKFWDTILEHAPQLALWKSLALSNTFCGLAQFLHHYTESGTRVPITSIELPWHIASLLGDGPLHRGTATFSLRNHIVLVRSTATGKDEEKVIRTEALTCAEYVEQRWGVRGLQILDDIATLAIQDNHLSLQRSYQLDGCPPALYTLCLSPDKSKFHLTLDEHPTNLSSCMQLVSLIDWVFCAVRAPSTQDSREIYTSTSSCQALATYATQDHLDENRTGKTGPLSAIKLVFRLSSRPLQKTEHDCWHAMFQSGWVVEVEDRSRKGRHFGRGLEMSFEIMAMLACVEYPVMVDGGVVLVGYQAALVPSKQHPSYTQFHLEVNHGGQINPFVMTYGQRAFIDDYTTFKSKRCFVGWCDAAHILLGTQFCSPYEVAFSGSQQRKDTLQFNGISTGLQMNSVPISAGITSQASFGLGSNRVSFSPSSVYSKMLRDAAKDIALIYDVTSKQSWGVPKLSAMLHMAHAWVKDSTSDQEFQSPSFQDPIPFAEPHVDGFAVAASLEQYGDVIVCGTGKDALRLRNLLLGLNINMLNTSGISKPSSGRLLFGFELMDVVTEPGRGSTMKQIPIAGMGRNSNWLKLANVVDLVLVCRGLGEAIKPMYSTNRKNVACNSLPHSLDLLAVHMSCMSRLTKRYGGVLASTVHTNEVPIAEGKSWKLSGETFKACNHHESSKVSCWEERTTILQAIRDTGTVCPDFTPRRIALSGAIVFGSKRRQAKASVSDFMYNTFAGN